MKKKLIVLSLMLSAGMAQADVTNDVAVSVTAKFVGCTVQSQDFVLPVSSLNGVMTKEDSGKKGSGVIEVSFFHQHDGYSKRSLLIRYENEQTKQNIFNIVSKRYTECLGFIYPK